MKLATRDLLIHLESRNFPSREALSEEATQRLRLGPLIVESQRQMMTGLLHILHWKGDR